MKIVHVCLCGPMTDGWNYQENLLTKYHRKFGLDVTVIASQWIWDNRGNKEIFTSTEYFNEDGVKMIRLPLLWGNVDTRLKVYKDLVKTLKREKPDILFIHDIQFLDVVNIVRYLRREKRDIKVYADNHVDYSNGASNWLSKNVLHKIIWRFVAQQINPYVKKFYGVLPARVEFLREMYRLPEEKCELLVMGADDDFVARSSDQSVIQKLREQYGISKDDFLIVTGGKIDVYKSETLLLMKAVQELGMKSVRLIVFGSVDESLRIEFDDLCDGEIVRYVGWLKAMDSYPYFAAADLVVFPGRHSVFWEQVTAQGRPMICKYWDGTTHVDLGGNVVFLKEITKDTLRNAIEEIVDDRDKYEHMKEVAQERGKTYFSYRDISRRAIEWR